MKNYFLFVIALNVTSHVSTPAPFWLFPGPWRRSECYIRTSAHDVPRSGSTQISVLLPCHVGLLILPSAALVPPSSYEQRFRLEGLISIHFGTHAGSHSSDPDHHRLLPHRLVLHPGTAHVIPFLTHPTPNSGL